MEGSVVVNDFHEEEYFGNVRLDDTAVLEMSEDVIISMKNLHKTYLLGVEGVPALRGVSLTIKRGEFVCIFGTSGGGKTTMLNIIGTIDKPTKGEMNLCGHIINHKTDDLTLAMLRLKKIGFVFQTFNLLSSLSALENVEMPMILAGELSSEERRARAIALLTMVGMGGRLDHVPSQLSGGEQQRVTIARAMANKPDILLLDEPTGDLDTANTAIVMKLLTRLNREEGITLVMVTHDVGLKMFSDRVVWMRDGKIQRIEAITDQARQDSHKRLDEEIERIEKKRAGLLARGPTATVIRDPHDYKPLSWRAPSSVASSSNPKLSGELSKSSSLSNSAEFNRYNQQLNQSHTTVFPISPDPTLSSSHSHTRSLSQAQSISQSSSHSQAPAPAPAPAQSQPQPQSQSQDASLPRSRSSSHSSSYQPHANGKKEEEGEENKGEAALEEIIDGISSVLATDDEQELKRRKPEASTALLVDDDDIRQDNGVSEG